MTRQTFRIAPTVLGTLLALALPALPAQATPDAAEIAAGDATLILPGSLPSSLDIAAPTLETAVCGRPGDQGGAGEIGLIVSNDGTSGPFILPVVDILFNDLEDIVRVTATRLQGAGSAPFETDCGRWSSKLRLDPDAVQPLSELRLLRDDDGEPTDRFAGALEVAVILDLTSETSGEAVAVPVLLRLSLSGRWSLADVPAGAGNLVLTAETATAAFLNPS